MSDKSSYAMVLKDTCDACGCATGWTGGSGSMDPPTEWDTVASQVVSSTSPNWDFGAREAGVWKITAFPEPGGVIHGGAFGDGVQTSNSGDLHWNSGGVTLDNTGMRDRSYLGQFYRYGFLSFGGGSSSMWPVGYRIGLGDDHTKYSSAVQIAQILAELGKIGANGHNPSKNIPKLNTWGHGFNFSPPYSSFHSTWHGWGTHTTHPFSPFANFAQFDMGFYGGQPTHIIQPVGAIFVWVSGLNEYALPADVLTASASYPDNYDDGLGGIYKSEFALHEGFRRHILPHTDGGTIAGSISDVTDGSGLHYTGSGTPYGGTEGGEANRGEDLTGEKWRVRLHKLATTTDTLWLSNEYNKGVKSIRFKRWSNHIGPSSHPGSWVFPLWSFDAELDRVAAPNMSACHHSLFKADLQAPFTWAPEHYLNALKHDGSSEIVARDRSLFNWDQGIAAPTDSTDGAAAAEASSGESFADGSYWIDNIARKVYTFDGSSWTLHPLPPANGMVRQIWKTFRGKWITFVGYGPDRYSTDMSWVGWTATPIFEDDTLGEELRLEGDGAGYGVPSYAARYIGGPKWSRGVGNQYVWQGQRPASRVHNSSKGGVPFCYNLGHLNPNDPQIIAGGNPTDPADEAVRIY